jgi:pimeloyl-ACP methyl ester carboxylesterase
MNIRRLNFAEGTTGPSRVRAGLLMLVAFRPRFRRRFWYGPALSVLSLSFVTGCSAAALPVDSKPIGIHRSERVAADGASLFVETHGMDRTAPVLLWLHGGPGGPERPLFRYFNSPLEEHFVVSYWDQRGAGRSYNPRADPHKLTIDRHLADLDIVVDHLRRSLGRRQIGLIGHSWGGALGLLYAKAHPDKLSALVAVAPLVSMIEAQRAQYEFVTGEASNGCRGLDRLRM